ncbi:malonate decarboxylase holo-ACP synthase [Streptomyces sp. J2-1]|uniref:malonate decarboxylase holo-ACP synthase n=1 Tax=Streptomyces corallincola TaxID=2851888 RepID=UPI001C3814B9|nr:malonate decarboxylase holo-ACP synthase [Streptomyces corallincola]MBV2353879.1 malonate decarboxylase holo-ACP synthase [Streptomyces corallincola]
MILEAVESGRVSGADAAVFLPHDLLHLADPGRLAPAPCAGPDRPGWVRDSLAAAPWAVVRRAPAPPGLVPVGVRGAERGHRWAAFVPAGTVAARLRPEQLTGRPAPRDLPVFRALTELARTPRPAWATAWGPGGSAGFELATGRPTARTGSDLDLVVRVPAPVAAPEVARLLARLASLPLRVDVQLQSPWGGFAAAEYARDTGEVLLRTDTGPVLVRDPWSRATPPLGDLV